MQEIFYEECAKIQNENSAKRKYNILKIMSILSFVVAVFWFLIVWFGYDFSGEGLLLKIIFVLLPFLSFIGLGIALFKLKDKMYVDYDYTFVSGSVRFSKVIKNVKRKKVLSFECSAIEKIGKYGSKTFEKYSLMPDKKVKVLSSNSSAEKGKDFYYLVVNVSGIKYVLILECTETFIGNIIRYSNRTVIEEGFFK